MFNKQPFNRGKFNNNFICDSSSINFYGSALISFGALASMSVVRAFKGSIDIALSAGGKINYVADLEGKAQISLLSDGKIIKSTPFTGRADFGLYANGVLGAVCLFPESNALIFLDASSKSFSTYRYEYIELPELVMRPGDELIVNTDEMTITLNGQNVVQYLSRASEFFMFNPNENQVIFTSSSPDDKADVKILWKDAYL